MCFINSQRKIGHVQYMLNVKFKYKIHIYAYTFVYICINSILLIRLFGYVKFPIL